MKEQGPLNSIFPRGQQAAFGVHTLRGIGSGLFANRTPAIQTATGLLVPTGADSGGIPGVSATYVSTGLFQIRFPPTRSVDINAVVSSSSGYNYQAHVNNQSGPSGSAQLELVRMPTSAGGPSGVPIPGALGAFFPTGTQVKLSFFVAPITDGTVTPF